jgi:hypothetical protein
MVRYLGTTFFLLPGLLQLPQKAPTNNSTNELFSKGAAHAGDGGPLQLTRLVKRCGSVHEIGTTLSSRVFVFLSFLPATAALFLCLSPLLLSLSVCVCLCAARRAFIVVSLSLFVNKKHEHIPALCASTCYRHFSHFILT